MPLPAAWGWDRLPADCPHGANHARPLPSCCKALMPERRAAPGHLTAYKDAAQPLGLCAYVDKGCPPRSCVRYQYSRQLSHHTFCAWIWAFRTAGASQQESGAVYTFEPLTNDSAAILRFAAVAVLCLTVAVIADASNAIKYGWSESNDAGRSDEDAKRPESGAGWIKAASTWF